MNRVKQIIAMTIAAGMLSVPIWGQAANSDAKIQADVQHSLDNKRYGGVQVLVKDGVVTLSGTVERLSDKLDAEKKASKDKRVASVQDEIRVTGGGDITDAELYKKLAKALLYDRQGYGTLTFNALTLEVHHGVATVGGVVVGPADKDSALNLVKDTPGVRGIVDQIEVAPLSPQDNRIRAATAQAVYGAAQLNRYAMDPAKPIRISVVNGHVTLVGMVDSQADKDIAGIRANGVPGVFSVTNHLQVAGKTE